jgi:hydrogenase maturation protein HypF
MKIAPIARKVEINGIVQGVGFRPFVFQAAHRHGIRGTVANTATGVSIHAEGAPEKIADFCRELAESPPPLAHITAMRIFEEAAAGQTAFTITASSGRDRRGTLISPDVAVCADCLAELFDPANRRFRYPFINCTNCGPRYTIIADIPYDRPKTAMKAFAMCPQCQAEYDDPLDRRFHAQPNACAACGPSAGLCAAAGAPLVCNDAIAAAADLLKAGAIVAVKGLGGYHLAVDAENPAALARLRRRKHRDDKPFAVMSRDLQAVARYARVTPAEAALLTSCQRPIVLLAKNSPHPLAAAIAPGNRWIGVMLPYTPVHHLLLAEGFLALVMTSGNLSAEPIAIANDEALDRLEGIADYFLVHDRDILLRSDDSVVRHAAGATRFLRRSRGFVPTPVFLKDPTPPILACGAELKNTVCLTRGDQAFVSQHVGDMENLATFEFFQETVNHLKRILDITPRVVAHDLHPDYLSTRFAEAQGGLRRVGVQHHHAHIVSCLAENQAAGPVIGLAFDGTGYGTDGAIWGGEVLLVEAARFRRAAHLAYVPLPGGAAAIREPWRMALSYLWDAFGDDYRKLDLPLLKARDAARIETVAAMVRRGLNAPPTSSLGRLFDAVAALAGIRYHVTFEGQAAMELEMAAGGAPERPYAVGWEEGAVRRIPPAPIIRGVVADLLAGVPAAVVSGRFHATLVDLFTRLCAALRVETGIERVALSGGVFQNLLLFTGLKDSLEKQGFTVFSHTRVPTSDGGIALGQAVVAAALLQDERLAGEAPENGA